MYAPGSAGFLLVKVGTTWEPLSEFTDFAINHTAPATTPATAPLDRGVSAQAATPGRVTPGVLSCSLGPPDAAGPAFRTFRQAAIDKTTVELQAWLGHFKEVGSQAAGANATTLAIDASAGEITLARKGTGNDAVPVTFGESDQQPGDFWDRGQIVALAGVAYHLGTWQSGTKRKVTRLGTIASGIVTPDDTALADVNASDAFTVNEYVLRITAKGEPQTGGDLTAAAGGLTTAMSVQLSAFEVIDYALKDATL